MQESNPSYHESGDYELSTDYLYYSGDAYHEDLSIVHRSQANHSPFHYWHQAFMPPKDDKFLTPHSSPEFSTLSWDTQPHVDSDAQKDSHSSEEYNSVSLHLPYTMNTLRGDFSENFEQYILPKDLNSRPISHCPQLYQGVLKNEKDFTFLYGSPFDDEKRISREEEHGCSTRINETWESSASQTTSQVELSPEASLKQCFPYKIHSDIPVLAESHCLINDGEHILCHEDQVYRKPLAVSADSDIDSITTSSRHLEDQQSSAGNKVSGQDTPVSLSTDGIPCENSIFSFFSSLSAEVQSEPCSLLSSSLRDQSCDPSPGISDHVEKFLASNKGESIHPAYCDSSSCFLPSEEKQVFKNSLSATTMGQSMKSLHGSVDEISTSLSSQDLHTALLPDVKPYYGVTPLPSIGMKSSKISPSQFSVGRDSNNNEVVSCMCCDKNGWVPPYLRNRLNHCQQSPKLNTAHRSPATSQCSSDIFTSSSVDTGSSVVNSVFRLSRSPTARAAIVQYPYPPVPAHCLPPLKHIQQQALFNEFLKIEKDALRIQLGHFIVEYCTRSIPDEYLRSERTPDPRIITDFVDQIILAVEIFGEQAQYVRAHNAIPTDINEVYISSWLQQKKEFLKPLEMLYIKREREKLLAEQNNGIPFQLNNMPYFFQARHRKRSHTSKLSEEQTTSFKYTQTLNSQVPSNTKNARGTQGLREQTSRQGALKDDGTDIHTLPRQRRGKQSRTSATSNTSCLTRRSSLCLSEELDGLGVPRIIHFENLRSAIEHRGIVVQLPSNNSGSLPLSSSSSLSSSSYNAVDSSGTDSSECTRQYRSLFNLLISGRGDTRRSRLQLPWGDTVNIKYNRTLLGIPDFLVEGLGYAHLGNNHPLIPKVCAVSLEGSLYGVEVLLFYRGLPCTKRVAKRYTVQQYEARRAGSASAQFFSENIMRLYHTPQTPTTLEKTKYELPVLHKKAEEPFEPESNSSLPWTLGLKDVAKEVQSMKRGVKEAGLAHAHIDGPTTEVSKTRKAYRGMNQLPQQNKRFKRDSINSLLRDKTKTSPITEEDQYSELSTCAASNISAVSDSNSIHENLCSLPNSIQHETSTSIEYGNVPDVQPLENYLNSEDHYSTFYFQQDNKLDDFSIRTESKLGNFLLYPQLQLCTESETCKKEREKFSSPQSLNQSDFGPSNNLIRTQDAFLQNSSPAKATQPLYEKDCLSLNKFSDDVYYKGGLVSCNEGQNHHMSTTLLSASAERCSRDEALVPCTESTLLHPERVGPAFTSGLTHEHEIEAGSSCTDTGLQDVKESNNFNNNALLSFTLDSSNPPNSDSYRETQYQKKLLNCYNNFSPSCVDLRANDSVGFSADEWCNPSFDNSNDPQNVIESQTLRQQSAPLQRNRLMVSCSTVERSLDSYHSHNIRFESPGNRIKQGKKSKNFSFSMYGTPTEPQNIYSSQMAVLHSNSTAVSRPLQYNYSSLPSYVCSTENLNIPYTVQNQNFYSPM